MFIGSASAYEQVLSTTIVGFEIKGVKPNHKTTIPDLEIVIKDDTVHYLALRRLLTEFGIKDTLIGDTLNFMTPDHRQVRMNVVANDVMIGSEGPYATDLVYGKSDFTGVVDAFVRENDLSNLLAMDIEWSEDAYAFSVTTKTVFPAWAVSREKKRGKGQGESKLQSAINALPAVASAGPAKLGDPSLHMLQPGIRMTQANKDYLQMQKSLKGWGRLGGGRYNFSMRQSGRDWSEEPVLERIGLTHRFGDFESTIGDAQMSFGDLMFPSGGVAGFQAGGMIGMKDFEREKDNTNFGRRDNFHARESVHGIAPVGSTVELRANSEYVAEQIITTSIPGDTTVGRYEFRDVAVSRDRSTELRVVITTPSGDIVERVIEPVGTNSLLRPGQIMFNAVAGVRRFSTPQIWDTQGKIAGGRVLVGVAPFWTVGGGSVMQSEYSLPFNLERLEQGSGVGLSTEVPRESRHGQFDTRLRFLKKHRIEAELGLSQSRVDPNLASRDPADSLLPPAVPWDQVQWGKQKFAARTKMSLFFGRLLRLEPMVLHYDSSFFTGSNSELHDREGYAIDSRVDFSRKLRISLTHGEVYNNLEGNAPYTVRQRWQHIGFPVPRSLPRSTIRFSADRFEEMRDFDSGADEKFDARYLGKIDVSSTLLRIADLTGNVSFGDELQDRHDLDLLRGLSLPNATSSSRPGWTAQLSRKLMKSGRLNLQHNKSDFREQTRLAHFLQATDNNPWNWRHEVGYDWVQNTVYFQTQPEFYLERTGASRVSLFARYFADEWTFSASLRLEPILSMVGGRPFLIPASRVNPSNGGIKGRVFMDNNGNGLVDRGEPGAEGIEVIGDGGRKAVTGKHGEFLLPTPSQRRQMRVSLNPLKIPVELTPTRGTQVAKLEPGLLTPIRLSVAKLGSISGFLTGPNEKNPEESSPVSGTRVVALNDSGQEVQESVTYSDGSFYLGELMPGTYAIQVDLASLPKVMEMIEFDYRIVVSGESDEKLNVSGIELKARLKSGQK